MPDAGITVNAQNFIGWTSVGVTRSMEQLAHSFEFEFVEAWTPLSQSIPIFEGNACTVALDSERVTNGYVSEATFDRDATNRTMHVVGASKTLDLVDCSAIHGAGLGQWLNRTLTAIAIDLCQPFGITVEVQADVGTAFPKFALQDGETVYEALERGARMRGVLLMTGTNGELLITRKSSTRISTVLQDGVNILKGNRRGDQRNRFSQYIVKGQVGGDDTINGRDTVAPKRTSSDSGVTRYRPLIVNAEGQATGTELQKRADWERNFRAGKSQRLTYTYDGWSHDSGLWAPNTLVRVIDPQFKVNAELLVVSVVQTKDNQGTLSTLELVDPIAMSIEPLIPKPNPGEEYL